VQQVRGLEYGLVQKQGGPCGILAAVQALLLAELAEVGGGVNLSQFSQSVGQ
jgi:hypothetical protein